MSNHPVGLTERKPTVEEIQAHFAAAVEPEALSQSDFNRVRQDYSLDPLKIAEARDRHEKGEDLVFLTLVGGKTGEGVKIVGRKRGLHI